jgi:hypothetical protein
VTVVNGVPPYSYDWNDGTTAPDRSGLGALTYYVIVTDANGCQASSQQLLLTQPERSDWTMNGNTGTNPATHYIGTADAQDVVFRSNGQERFRITSAGEVKVSALQFPAGYSLLYADSTGSLKSGPALHGGPMAKPCPVPWPWTVCGNTLVPGQWLGSSNAAPLIFRTHDVERMRIEESGKVVIGPADQLNTNTTYPYGLYVANGIITEKVKVAVANQADWSDHVFAPGYRLMPLTEVEHYINTHGHLPDVPSAACMVEEGLDVVTTDAMLLKKIEELTLYILELRQELNDLRANTISKPTE